MCEYQPEFYYPTKSQPQPFVPYLGKGQELGYLPPSCRRQDVVDSGMFLAVNKTNYLLIFIGLMLLLGLIMSVVKTIILAKQYGQTSAEVAHLRNHFLYNHLTTAPATPSFASVFRQRS